MYGRKALKPCGVWPNHERSHHERLQFGNGNIWFDRTKVTNDQYAEFLAISGWRPLSEQNWLKSWLWGDDPEELPTVPPGDGNRPVNWVSRYDAEEFCKFYDKRLPESFEWQFVAQVCSTVCVAPWQHGALG